MSERNTQNKPSQSTNSGSRSGFFSVMQSLSYLTQLGFSLVTPPVLFFMLAYYLQNRFDWGGWVWIAAIILGFGGAFSSFAGFARFVKKKADKDSQTPPTAFNK